MSSMYLVRIEELDGSRAVYNLLFHDRQKARAEVAAVTTRTLKEFWEWYEHDLDYEEIERLEGYGDLIRDDDQFYLADVKRATVERVPVVDQP